MLRTLVLFAVNLVTVSMLFFPVTQVTTPGYEESFYFRTGGLIWFFIAQIVLGVMAILIDLLNKRKSFSLVC